MVTTVTRSEVDRAACQNFLRTIYETKEIPADAPDFGDAQPHINNLLNFINGNPTIATAVVRGRVDSDPVLKAFLGRTAQTEETDDEFDADFLEYDELISLPPPQWLIYDILPTVGINFLASEPKAGKTYLTLSMSCTIAVEPSGNRTQDAINADLLNWCGRETRHGDVIYIAAEDIDDIAERVRGWAKYHHIQKIPHLHFFKRALQIRDEHERFMKALDRRYKDADIKLIVIDTLAMCTAGIEENSKKDFDAVIAAAEKLWRKYNCCVLIVHHAGKNGSMRGTSAMGGVCYTLMEIESIDEKLVLKCKYKRRGKNFEDIYFDWQTVELDYCDEKGDPATTSVVTRSDYKKDSDAQTLTKMQQNIVDVAIALGGIKVARSDIKRECKIDQKQERSFINATKALVKKEIFRKVEEGRYVFYTVQGYGKEENEQNK